MQKISYKKFIPGIAWFFVILLVVCLPGEDVPDVGWLDDIDDFDKIVHIIIFFILGVLFGWPLYKSPFSARKRVIYFICIAFAVSAWGLTTEFIQKLFVPGRSFDISDWIADSLGALLSYWFCTRKFSKVTE